jgi:hypothetical protein
MHSKIAAIVCLLPCIAFAREMDDYLGGTAVADTDEAGGVQAESNFMRMHDLWLGTFALEYGISADWQVSSEFGYGRALPTGALFGADTNLGSSYTRTAEIETRYRAGTTESGWPCEVTLALGLQMERLTGESATWNVQPRVILQKNLGRFSAVLNLGAELGDRSSFQPAFGARYAVCEAVALACEVQGDLADHSTTVVPQVILRPSKEITFMVGCAIANTDSHHSSFKAGLIWDF